MSNEKAEHDRWAIFGENSWLEEDSEQGEYLSGNREVPTEIHSDSTQDFVLLESAAEKENWTCL